MSKKLIQISTLMGICILNPIDGINNANAMQQGEEQEQFKGGVLKVKIVGEPKKQELFSDEHIKGGLEKIGIGFTLTSAGGETYGITQAFNEDNGIHNGIRTFGRIVAPPVTGLGLVTTVVGVGETLAGVGAKLFKK